ncbi:MAG: hypothetical protein VR70_05680 [Rhodospirillaceae bacterium BRH_c57]|nr:MAG: hypothetical protein VR70_05680 [Rhodospirillaceae bacterium BRH_c57]
MPGAKPPKNFSASPLVLDTVSKGTILSRITANSFPDPLGYARRTLNRFSDPRRRRNEKSLFGVVYFAASLEACFVETLLRDRGDGRSQTSIPIDLAELRSRDRARVQALQPLRLVSLIGAAPLRMGVPSDVTGATNQVLARWWSVAFHDHPVQPDGILYPSRRQPTLTNIALYDRALPKLDIIDRVPLLDCRAEMTPILKTYPIDLI